MPLFQPFQMLAPSQVENACICSEKIFIQEYNLTDLLTFQFKSYDIETGENIDIIETTGDVINGYYGLCFNGEGSVSVASLDSFAFADNENYSITITVSGMTFGIIYVTLRGNDMGSISHDGTYTFSANAGTSSGYILLSTDNADGCIIVEDISRICSFYALVVKDAAGNFVTVDDSSVDNTGFSQYGYDVAYSKRIINIPVNESVGFDFSGCKIFCLYDNCANNNGNPFTFNAVQNPNFNPDLTGWTVSGTEDGTWIPNITTGQHYAEKAGMGAASIRQDGILKIGCSYSLSILFQGNATGAFSINLGGNSTIFNLSSFNGIKTIPFQVATIADFGISANAGAIGRITGVTVNVNFDCLEFEACSQTIQLNPTPDEPDCSTKLLTYRNNENSFGFNFTNFPDFLFQLRLKSRFLKPKYPEESDDFQDTAGNDMLLYFNGRKTRILAIDPVNEQIHDALFLARRHDQFMIDADSYLATKGVYQPNWDDNTDLAPSEIEVTKSIQEFENSYCS